MVRKAALEVLGKLEAAALAQHAAAVVVRLGDSNQHVREKAVEVLRMLEGVVGKLEAAVLEQHAAAVVAWLEEGEVNGQAGALKWASGPAVQVLGMLKLGPSVQWPTPTHLQQSQMNHDERHQGMYEKQVRVNPEEPQWTGLPKVARVASTSGTNDVVKAQ